MSSDRCRNETRGGHTPGGKAWCYTLWCALEALLSLLHTCSQTPRDPRCWCRCPLLAAHLPEARLKRYFSRALRYIVYSKLHIIYKTLRAVERFNEGNI